jgi:unsaturated rhamnogalacturonyl hydrolase
MKYLKNILFIVAAAASLSMLSCKDDEKAAEQRWSEKMAVSEMTRFPELWMIENASKPKWSYTFGLVARSVIELWKETGDQQYFDYAKGYADSLITTDGIIKTYSMDSYNIDHLSPGKILFDLYAETGDTRYKKAIDTLYTQSLTHPRTSEGGFWHKLKYPHQMWLDGIYMASPFLAQYAATFDEPALFDDVVHQITLIDTHTYDKESGLFYHGWDESRQQAWADKGTGTSPGFWSRSMGWYGAAIVDVLDYLPKDHPGRDSLLEIAERLASGIQKYQDPQSGTWYQVTDQGDREGNYLESSASSLFVYFLAKALNNNYIDASYRETALKGFEGIIHNFIKPEEDGTYTITNCCAVAGLGGNGITGHPRDGSFEYYVSEPVIENDPKSTGSFILAALEIEKLKESIK